METKKCPFCGSMDNEVIRDYPVRGVTYLVECKNCGARGPNHLTIEQAIKMWNMRREEMPSEKPGWLY